MADDPKKALSDVNPIGDTTNKQLGAQIGSPYGLPQEKLMGVTYSPDAGDGTEVLSAMAGGTDGYQLGINEWLAPGAQIQHGVYNQLQRLASKHDLTKEGLPVSLDEINTHFGLGESWEKNRDAVKQTVIDLSDKAIARLEGAGVSIRNFGGDKVLYDDFTRTLKQLNALQSTGRLRAQIVLNNIELDKATAEQVKYQASAIRVTYTFGEEKETFKHRVFDVPIPSARGTYTVGGSDAPVRRIVGYTGFDPLAEEGRRFMRGPKSPTSLAISSVLDYDFNRGFYRSDNLTKLDYKAIGEVPPSSVIASIGHANLEEAHSYLKGINIANIDRMYGISQVKPDVETAYHRMYGLMRGGMNVSFWTGASEETIHVSSPSSAYQFMVGGTDILASKIFGVDSLAFKQTPIALGKHAAGRGYVRIPGIQHSSGGVTNQLNMDPAAFPGMDPAKRNQLAVAELTFTPQTLQRYGSQIQFHQKLGGRRAELPLLKMKTYHADPEILKAVLQSYKGGIYKDYAPFEDTLFANVEVRKDIEYMFDTSQGMLNARGIPVGKVGGRNVVDAASYHALDEIAIKTGRTFSDTERQSFTHSVNQYISANNLTIGTAIKEAISNRGFEVNAEEVTSNAFAAVKSTMKAEANGKPKLMGFSAVRGKKGKFTSQAVYIDMDEFDLHDIKLPGGPDDSFMQFIGKKKMKFGWHSKLTGSNKGTMGGFFESGDVGPILAKTELVRQRMVYQGLSLAEALSRTHNEEDVVRFGAMTESFKDVRFISVEGVRTGGYAKGAVDINLAKDIVPSQSGSYQFAQLGKATRLQEDITGIIETLARLDLSGLDKIEGAREELAKVLRPLGFEIGPNGEMIAIGGLDEVAAAKPGTILEMARFREDFPGMVFSERRRLEANYLSQLAVERKLKLETEEDIMRLAESPMTEQEITNVMQRLDRTLKDTTGAGLEYLSNTRMDWVHNTLIRHSMVPLLEPAQQLSQFMEMIGQGQIRYNMYNVKDESHSVRYTNTKQLGKKNLFYRAEKGLLSAEQSSAFMSFKSTGQLPAGFVQQMSYLFAGVGADKSNLITGSDIANVLKFENLTEDQKAFYHKIANSLDTSLGMANKSQEEALNSFIARYGVKTGADTNQANVARFMAEVMVHPDVNVRGQILGKLFGNKTMISTNAMDYRLKGEFEGLFTGVEMTNYKTAAPFTLGAENSIFRQMVERDQKLRKILGKNIKQSRRGDQIFSEGLSLLPETYGYKGERATPGKGHIASYAEEDFLGAIRKTLMAQLGIKKTEGEYIWATQKQLKKQTFGNLFAYAIGTATSASKDEKLVEMLSETHQTIMGQAAVTDVTRTTQYSHLLQRGATGFVDEEAAVDQMLKANQESVSKGGSIIYTYKEMQQFREGMPIITTGVRNPLNTSSRLAAMQIFSGKAYGANFQDAQRVALYHGEGMSKEYFKAFSAYLNLDTDGDRLESTLANSPEMRKKMELMFEMQTRAMTEVIDITKSKVKLNLQETMDRIKAAVRKDLTDVPEDLISIHSAEAFFRIGLTGGRKAVKELEKVAAQQNADPRIQKVIDLFDSEVGQITNVGNIMSTLAKANSGEFRDMIVAKTGINFNLQEIRSLFDALNEQFLEAPANIKNYHQVEVLLSMAEDLMDKFGKIKDYHAEAETEVKKILEITKGDIPQTKENLALIAATKRKMEQNAITDTFSSYLDIISHAMGPLANATGDDLPSNMRRAIGGLIGANTGIGGFKQIFEELVSKKGIHAIVRGDDLVYMMAELEGKQGLGATLTEPMRNLFHRSISERVAQPALAKAATQAAEMARDANASRAVSGGGRGIPSMKANSVTSSTVSGSAQAGAEAAEAAAKITAGGGTLIDEFNTGALEDRLIRMLEAKDGQMIGNMKRGGWIGAGIFAGAIAASAIFNNVVGHTDLENDDKGSSRAIATGSRESKAIANDSTHYSGPVRVTDNPGMYNYNSVSRSSNYRAMRGVSRADIINGAGPNSNVNVVNEVSKRDLESAIGENYGKDSY